MQLKRYHEGRSCAACCTFHAHLYPIDQCTRDVLPEVVEVSLPVSSGSAVSLAPFRGTIENLHCCRVTSAASTSTSGERPAR